MREASNRDELRHQFAAAQTEARNAFGDDAMYVEKLIVNPKHIEFQIMGDAYGNVVHLGERDCSIQRKHQKVLEEAPSGISPEQMCIRDSRDRHRRRIRCGSANGSVGQHEYGQGHGRIYGIVAGIRLDW